MDSTKIYTFIIFLAFLIFGMAAIMEFYKKTIRKDKSKKWENILISFVLSAGVAFLLKAINVFIPILGVFDLPWWADCILYTIIIYFLQKYADMSLLKKLMKSYVKKILVKANFTETEAENIIECFRKPSEN